MHQLLVNQIWQHNGGQCNGEKYRLLNIDKDLDQIFWINVKDDKALFELIGFEDFQNKISDGTLTICDEKISLKDPLNFKEKSIKKWEAYCEIIDLIKDEEPLIFTNKFFNRRCVEISNQLSDFSRQSVRRIILKYYRNGKTKLGLLPDLDNSGARGKKIENPTVKLGRKNKYTKNNFLINRANRRIIEKGYSKFYLKVSDASLETAYENFLAVKYPETALGIYENAPSFMQFRKVGEDKFGPEERKTAKKSKKVFDKDLRITSESSKINVIGPGSLWQIDSTIADVELVSHLNRSTPIGSPTLYFITDVFSHAIVGLLVTLEEPSFFTAAHAIYNAIQDKSIVIEEAGLSQIVGFEFNGSDWNISGLPQAIVADRAELLGRKADNIIRDLGINIENTPAYRADLKGIVENHFNVLHTKLKGVDARFGMKSTNHKKRGVRDARKDACLTLKEYYAIMIRSVIDYNNTKYLENYPFDKDMLNDKLELVPQKLLEWGIENRSGLLRSSLIENLRIKLLPIEKGALTKDGLKFKDGWYNLPDDHEIKNTMIMTQDKRIYYDVHFNPIDLNEVYIKGTNEIIPAQVSKSRSPLHAEASAWEIKAHIEEEKYRKHQLKEINRTANINTANFTRQLIDNAKSEQPGEKRAKNLKANKIRENRNIEKNILKQQNASQIENPTETNNSSEKAGKVIPMNIPEPESQKDKSKTDFFRRLMEDE